MSIIIYLKQSHHDDHVVHTEQFQAQRWGANGRKSSKKSIDTSTCHEFGLMNSTLHLTLSFKIYSVLFNSKDKP